MWQELTGEKKLKDDEPKKVRAGEAEAGGGCLPRRQARAGNFPMKILLR